jgi:anaerobic selenocysteine-containing dehydrogenase
MERRNFFRILGTTSAGLASGACSRTGDTLIPLLVSDRDVVPAEEQWHATVCGECEAGCGVIARVMEGERILELDDGRVRQRVACIKKVEGNPLDPVSGGRLCARGQAGVQSLYHPDRLHGPLRRVGRRGQAELAPISWKEAILVAAERVGRVRQKDPSRILFLARPQAGTRALAIAQFQALLGAPPPVGFGLAAFPLERRAAELVFGWSGLPVYDLANARYVLGVGADFLGGWASPVYYARQYGLLRQGRPGVRGRLVHAESRLSLTASSADEWLPLRPGSEPHFLAALGCLVLESKLAREPQTAPRPVLEAFRSCDVAAAARETGLDERRLRRVASELGASEAPVVLAGASAVHTNSLEALVAAAWLNLLLGAVGRPGGVLPPAPDPTRTHPAFGNAVAQLERAEVLFTDGVNPAYLLPRSTGVEKQLARIETQISFSPFVDDTAAWADLLLPDHHALESSAAIAPPVSPVAALNLATAFAQPLHDTRSVETVLAELAKQMQLEFVPPTPRGAAGLLLPPDLPWEDAARQGGVWVQLQPPKPPAAPKQAPAVTPTPPSFDGDPNRFPILFQPYLSLQYHDGRSAHLPWMQELPDPASSAMWSLPVEIDPQTAARLGVRNGDLVRVESAHGSLEAPVYVHPAALPGVASMAIGEGHRHYGRYASGRGANPLSILAPVFENSTGALVLGGTRVRLAKVKRRTFFAQFSPNDREHNPFAHR